MSHPLIQRWHRWRFEHAVKALADTPALHPGNVPYTALSMVQHRDVLPYLLALKSFARFLPPQAMVMVADPSIDANDRALLLEHVPQLQIRDAAEFRHPGLPVGGCWERLSAIGELVGQQYVVQLDADTVALAMPQDVLAAINARHSFTLGTEDVQHIVSSHEIAPWARGRLDGNDHVQDLCEAQLDAFDPEAKLRYGRGCAGFAGFAPGSFDRAKLLDLSARMQALLGEKTWRSWGTEQFSSNLLMANSPGGHLLPHPSYCAPHRRTAQTVFLHFIGYVRFQSGLYAQLAGDIAAQLRGRA